MMLTITLFSILLGIAVLLRSDKRKHLTAQESFSSTDGGDLKTKALVRYYNNFSLDFYVRTQEPNVVLVSLNTDPIIVAKLSEGVLVIGVVSKVGSEVRPAPLSFTKFTRSTFYFNDNDWHYVKLSFNESINRLLCKVDNNPLISLPLTKPSWSKVQISFGKVDDTKYTSPNFKGCFFNLGYTDELSSKRLNKDDMVSTYLMKVC